MSPLLLILLSACQPEPEPWSRAFVMEDLSQGVGGPKAMARPGDFILENDRIKVAITGGHTSIGPSIYGGTVIDVDLQRPSGSWTGGEGNDRFAELFPTVSMNVARAEDESAVEIINDGSNGEAAVVRVTAVNVGFLELLEALWIFAYPGDPDYEIVTDYILEPGAPYLTMRTTAWFGDGAPFDDSGEVLQGSSDILPLLELALETGLAFGDFYLQGGDVDLFAPGIGFDEDGAVYEWSLDGRNTFAEPVQMPFVGGAADGVSYALGTVDGGDVFVPLFTSSQTAAFAVGVEGDPDLSSRFPTGSAFTYERVLAVGEGDVGGALDGILAARGTPVGTVSGHVVSADTSAGVSGAMVFVYEPGADRPFSQWTTDVSLDDNNGDGSFGGTLPPGDWELLVHETGRPDGERVSVSVSQGEEIQLTLTAPRTGEVGFEIVDEEGLPVPAKVTIFRSQGQSLRDPILGDGYIPGGSEAVMFAPYGHGDLLLPPGRYEAWASRGPEYELGVVDFEVTGSQRLDLQLQVVRSVDTSGWVSADFHVHAQPSHDSGVTLPERVFTMACENVEFLVSSDHDYISDYRPVIEDVEMEQWLTAAVGLEVTPIEYGHFIGFPLRHDYLAMNGGAFDWAGLTPDDILDGLRELGDNGAEDPVTFVAHPRDGILGYFDQYGLDLWIDPESGLGPEPGDTVSSLVSTPVTALTSPTLAPSEFTFDFDALELLNGKRFEFIRFPTQDELDRYNAGEDVRNYEILARTLDEQQRLIEGGMAILEDFDNNEDNGPYYLFADQGRGQVDDWFSLLNLGYRFTAMGNSDTHGKTSIEAGCPRNYVVSSTDDPAFIDAGEIAQAVKDGKVITSYGPFIRFWADNDPDKTVGSEIEAGSTLDLYIEVQSPSWFNVDRVELYENGVLIEEFEIPTPNADVLNFAETVTVEADYDAWYVVIAMGDDDLSPLYTPVDIPPVVLQDVVLEALGGVEALASFLSPSVEQPLTFPTTPYALTNPIWVDRDGGGFDPPGLPEWMVAPQAPAEEDATER